MTWGSCGKNIGSWRLVEVVKNGILVKRQKVFDAWLIKQMNSIWHDTPQGEMAHIIRSFNQFWAHLGKVANAAFVNPRNQQKWLYQDLVMQIYSPWCTTWCSVNIWGFEHVHTHSDQKDTPGNVKLFKLGSGQRGFWGTFVNQKYFYWYETLHDHHIMHMWLGRIFLDFYENISCRNKQGKSVAIVYQNATIGAFVRDFFIGFTYTATIALRKSALRKR